VSELFIHLVGTCVVYWCTFSVNWETPAEPSLIVRAWDKQADVIDIHEYPFSSLTLGAIILDD